jgi:hypothetical protein
VHEVRTEPGPGGNPRVTIGFRVHCGWAAAVVIAAAKPGARAVMSRRMPLWDPKGETAPQVFHAAAELAVAEAAGYVRAAATRARERAFAELNALLAELRGEYDVCGAALVAGNGRPVRELDAILRSHTAIHAAEGELFREAMAGACEAHGLSALQVPSRDIYQIGVAATGESETVLRRSLATLGIGLGAPWGRDQKEAALVALLALYRNAVA